MATTLAIICFVVGINSALSHVRRDTRPVSPPCPAEWNISPCTCTGRPGSPDMNCSLIQDGDSLQKIFHANPEGKNFRAIEIHGSPLKSLPANVFGKNNFYLFFLNDNQIEKVDKDAFKGSEESAELLRFENNKITSFPFEALGSLKNVRVLQLERNQLTEVPANAFPHLEDMQMVDLSDNKIQTIGKNAFSKLSTLKRLDLAHNQLTAEGVDESAFTGLTSLESLDISYNNFKTLSEKLFGDILKQNITIHTENNPLNCEDPSMAWIKALPNATREQLRNLPC